jgi:biopolymer transport protein ExbD
MSAFVAVLIILYFVNGGVPLPHKDLGGNSAPTDLFTAIHASTQNLPFDAISISLQRDGKMFLQSQQVSPGDLTGEIRERVRQGAKKRIYISVDRQARYRSVSEMLNAVRNAGLIDVTFMVSPHRALPRASNISQVVLLTSPAAGPPPRPLAMPGLSLPK